MKKQHLENFGPEGPADQFHNSLPSPVGVVHLTPEFPKVLIQAVGRAGCIRLAPRRMLRRREGKDLLRAKCQSLL